MHRIKSHARCCYNVTKHGYEAFQELKQMFTYTQRAHFIS